MKRLILMALYIATLLSALLLKEHELGIFAVHCVILIIVCVLHANAIQTALFALLIGSLAFVAELACVKSGMWTYHNVHWIMPLWLPVTWAIAALFITDVYNAAKLRHHIA